MGLFFLIPPSVLAQNEESLGDTVYQAKVIAILSEGEKSVALAVPLTTFLAAFYVTEISKKN